MHFVTSAALVEDRPELRKRVAVVKQQRVRAPAAAADADGSEKPVNLRDCNLSWTPACVRGMSPSHVRSDARGRDGNARAGSANQASRKSFTTSRLAQRRRQTTPSAYSGSETPTTRPISTTSGTSTRPSSPEEPPPRSTASTAPMRQARKVTARSYSTCRWPIPSAGRREQRSSRFPTT